ncbi:MAG: CbtB-domain containing protein [Nitriliruptor sp.]
MSSLSAASALRPTVHERYAALAWALVLSTIIFLVSFEQGMLTAGAPVAHELFHDARHLLGFPCH